MLPRRRPRGRRPRPRGDLHRRGARARAADRPLDGAPGGRAGARGRRPPARPHPPLHALRRRRDPRRGARDLRAHRGSARLRQRRGALPREGRARAAPLRRRAGERVSGPADEGGTRVQRRLGPARRFGPLGMALAGAGGFLAGVLLIAILGGAQPVYKERTLTVAAATGHGRSRAGGPAPRRRARPPGERGPEGRRAGRRPLRRRRRARLEGRRPGSLAGRAPAQGDTVRLDVDRA